MISTEKETLYLKALKLKALSEQGDLGEKINAQQAFYKFLNKHNLTVANVVLFDRDFKNKECRIVYSDFIFYKTDEIIAFLKKQPFKIQLKFLFCTLKQALKQKFKTK